MRALYFDVQGEPTLGLLHPATGTAGPCVLICPPFGREDATSYRSRRRWADALARAGMPAFRFDLPGTGDSGGRIDAPGRFESWTAAVVAAARFLQAETARPRTAAIGIGLGGMLAVAALEEGALIDDLVLWGVPAGGRAFVRELSVFARIESASIVAAGAPEPPAAAATTIAPGGFPFPAELLDAVAALDLGQLRLPHREGRRALLLARDGIAPDDELRKALEGSGVHVQVADGDGYAAMMTVLPEEALLPDAVTTRVEAWLRTETLHARTAPPAPPPVSASAELTTADGRVRETPLEVDHETGRIFGILAEPVDAPPAGLALVLLNAGAIRRSGPSRLWVELARRWAAQGVPTLRVDLGGIGDASGENDRRLGVAGLYADGYVGQVKAALDALTARLETDRFALVGLCAGAYWGFHTALVDDRVSLVMMLNPRLLFWDAEIVEGRDAVNRRRRILRGSAWRELWTGPWWAVPGRMLTRAYLVAAEPLRSRARRRAREDARASTEAALDRLEASGTRAVFAFCDGEPLRDDLTADGMFDRHERWPHLEALQLPGRDHVLRPLWMHEHVDTAIDEVVASELARNTDHNQPGGRMTIGSSKRR